MTVIVTDVLVIIITIQITISKQCHTCADLLHPVMHKAAKFEQIETIIT